MGINETLGAVVVGAALLLHAPRADATTYYVSGSGSNSNSGTAIGTPFLTIQKAAGLTKPGDIVDVMSGSYGPVMISRSGSASGGYITYQAYPGQHPVINKTANAWNGIQILHNTHNIVIDGFTIIGNAKHITVSQAQSARDRDFTTNGNCIGAAGTSHHIIIRNNDMSYCPGGGFAATGDYLYIYKNTIHHNAYWSALGTSGITVSGTDSDSSTAGKIFIYGNIINNNQNFICNRYQTHPCRITDGEGIIVDSNKSTHFGGRVLIFNNVVYNNGGPGIEVYRSQHVDIYNNTTYLNNISATQPAPFTAHKGGGEISISESDDVRVLNNISYGSPSVPIIYAGIRSVTNLLWDYNILFNGIGAVAWGAHDLAVDPLLRGPGSFDFHLQAGSPAIGSGTPVLAPKDDFAGNPRPAGKVDRGAYQF